MYSRTSPSLRWQKSSHSKEHECVEIAFAPDATAVRDSKNPGGPALSFATAAFTSFLTSAKQGRLDR